MEYGEAIMGRTALVLSGGGAKGAFQVGVEKYLREEKGFSWDIIAGVSVGALNGAMLAMERYRRLEVIWRTICHNRVYTGKVNLWTAVRLFMGKLSIYGNDPLAEIIESEVEPENFKVDLRVGTVSLRTGRYTIYRGDDPNIKKAILASTVVPLLWPPQYVSSECQYMVDGSLIRFSPIGDVLDADPEEVVVINCWPRDRGPRSGRFRNVLDIGLRALDISSAGIISSDIHEFTHINRNVKEAGEHGVTLHNEKGKPYKFYKYLIIEPEEYLGSLLDFSYDAIQGHVEKGWNRAKEILG
ncbi:MAG: patatin-like phospholipase family protein [bacterium]|nr:MAG: patatin-like phospholipase family protein [bacterium]